MPQNNTDEDDILTNIEANSGSNTESEDQNSDEDTENSEESVSELKSRLAKLEENYRNQKIRAEKAEQDLKKSKPAERGATSKSPELSAKDIIAITNAGVTDEDLDVVMEYARFKNIAISEAIKSPIVRTTLNQNAEYRKSAQASNTGSTRTGSAKVSGEMLLENARRGILPESDEEIRKLIKARQR